MLDCSACCFQLDSSASCRPAAQSGGHAGCRSRRATNGRLPLNLPRYVTGLRRDCRGWAGGGEVDARRLDKSRRHWCCGLSRTPRGYVKMHLDTMYHRLCPHSSTKPTRARLPKTPYMVSMQFQLINISTLCHVESANIFNALSTL